MGKKKDDKPVSLSDYARHVAAEQAADVLLSVQEDRGLVFPPPVDPAVNFELDLAVSLKGYGTKEDRQKLAGRICQMLRVELHNPELLVFLDGHEVEPLTYKVVE